MTSRGGLGMVLGSLLVSLLLAVYPLPLSLQWLRPEWTAMVIIYWAIMQPWCMGVGLAWGVGLLLDGFQGVTLGQNAIGFAVVAYICHGLHQRMRHFAILQQATVVFVLVGLHLLLGHWVKGMALSSSNNLMFLLTAMASASCWPLFVLLMQVGFSVSPRRCA